LFVYSKTASTLKLRETLRLGFQTSWLDIILPLVVPLTHGYHDFIFDIIYINFFCFKPLDTNKF